MMQYVLPFIFFMGFSGEPTPIETIRHYDIIVKDKIVGSLSASQKTKGPKTMYQSLTSIKTKLIREIEVDYKYDVTFDSSILKKANVSITVNDRPHARTSTVWKNTEYEIVKDEQESTLKESIQYATILLYFKEPTDVQNCYSEQDGTMNTIVSLKNHSYKKINSKGKENTYYYKNGILHKAIIDGGVINFELLARD